MEREEGEERARKRENERVRDREGANERQGENEIKGERRGGKEGGEERYRMGQRFGGWTREMSEMMNRVSKRAIKAV